MRPPHAYAATATPPPTPPSRPRWHRCHRTRLHHHRGEAPLTRRRVVSTADAAVLVAAVAPPRAAVRQAPAAATAAVSPTGRERVRVRVRVMDRVAVGGGSRPLPTGTGTARLRGSVTVRLQPCPLLMPHRVRLCHQRWHKRRRHGGAPVPLGLRRASALVPPPRSPSHSLCAARQLAPQ